MLRKIISGSILIWIFFLYPYQSIAINYYWIGGSGSWSDINHWVTTSGGGINHLQVPTPFDDVFFDANSFTAINQIVTIDVVNSVCRDINWTGAGFTPTFTGSYNFRIYGSLILIPAMNWNYYGSIFFESTSPGKTISSAGKSLFSGVTFQGIGGGWMLIDEFNVSGAINLTSGSLNTNSQLINCTQFYSSSGNLRSLILGSSVLTINAYQNTPGLTINSTNLTLNPGTSVFKIYYSGDTCSITGNQPISLYDLELINNSPPTCSHLPLSGADFFDIRSKTTMHKLTVSGQFICMLNDSTNIVNVKIDSLIVNNCTQIIQNQNNYSINTILCNANTRFSLSADQNDTIHNIFFNGTLGEISGNGAKFHKVVFTGDGNIGGINTFDSLSFAAGKMYKLSSTQTINNFFSADGNCSGSITLFSSNSGSPATIYKTSGNVIVSYVILRDIHASGGANFVANNSCDLGNNTGWTINSAAPLNLYWVGGTGDWNDVNHWSYTSGGPGGACVPSPFDNVFFNASSFSAASHVVTVNDENVFCKDMDWTGSLYSPTITGNSLNSLHIYGSLKLISGMNWSSPGQVLFESTSLGNTITLGGNMLNNMVTFQGSGGGWTFMDAFSSGSLYFITGTLNTNNQPMTCTLFNSSGSSVRSLILGSSVVIVNAPLYVNGLEINSTNLSFNAGFSVFKVNYSGSSAIISGVTPISFYDIELNNYTVTCPNPVGGACADKFDVRVKSYIHKLTLSGYYNDLTNIGSGTGVNVHIDSLIVNDGWPKEMKSSIYGAIKNHYIIQTIICNPNSYCILWTDQNDTIQNIFFNGFNGIIYGNNSKFHKVIYTGNGSLIFNSAFDTLSFGEGKTYYLSQTQTINDYFSADGGCSGWITMFGSNPGTQATLTKYSGNVTINHVILRDMNATGGANFVAYNSVDLGNNTGWVINSPTPLNLFWVGGTGDSNDPNHWSLTSGGPGGACIPSPFDNVFFDANSFSAPGQVVNVFEGTFYCHDMDWTGANYNPTFAGGGNYFLRIYGSLKLIPEMFITYQGYVYFEATTPGKTVISGGQSLNWQAVFQGIGGGWSLETDFSADLLSINSGIFNTNNHSIHCNSFSCGGNGNATSLLLGSSVISINSIYSTYPHFYFNSTNLTMDAGSSVFKINSIAPRCEISGDQPISFNKIEITNTSSNCSNISALGAGYFDIRATTNINKLTLSGQYIQLQNNGLDQAQLQDQYHTM
ncbi:MAG: hypothetical protein NTX43_01245 [Bacteroidetes bacterium]|nr:hypothetical protein [Bacteroidota bacterium]